MTFLYITISAILIGTMCMKFTSADVMTRFVFTGSGTCDTTERNRITAIFGPDAITNRRQLLRSSSLSTTTSNETVSRDLNAYQTYCKRQCAGYTFGRCFATGCAAYRGRRDLSAGDSSDENVIEWNLMDEENKSRHLITCNEATSQIQSQLDSLRNTVSNSCRAYLGDRNSRQVTCYNDVIYGEVHGAKVWKFTSSVPQVLSESLPSSGFSFCKSTSFNIEALNDPCVDNAVLDLQGPNGFSYRRGEMTSPYALFGDYEGNLHDRTLNDAGLYTLTITPDGFSEKKKVFTFTLTNC